ncbi:MULTISPECIES: ArdC family protein [unclassified Sphingomonas]|jgi:antirestriction protein ArdC|uniref:ArdC family protein n=1 Tax=unclassified Sphingomonas TaxID=196159 RepID=UPI0021513FF3|nr:MULTISPECIES: zincin-like metallopeptidase domain-containing protein [unclassified Sphingomonas]MCR5871014.1 ssDNA-binding domain-containing protein [Sphingomonas sp. J344]UUY00665.1 ssDNA-binding domain-containing protein [Sphingomonas sp. J315]
MPRHRPAGDGPRASLYDEVTQRIVAELEQGCVPWVQPWDSAAAGPSLPRNALTARCYSGVNILILWASGVAGGFSSQSWLTFRQAQQAGGCVRKGERGTGVVFADRFIPQAELERATRDGEAAKAVPFLKRFTVFNVAQCDGLRPGLADDPAPLPRCGIAPVAEAVIDASRADFRVGGAHAFYAPGEDYVQVPPHSAFGDPINWYRTALHELTHWTGHGSRLARDLSGPFASAAYAREELVAEMGAAFLCAHLGIHPSVRHADYIAAWLAVLRTDNRAIFRAAAAASRAADYLLALLGEAKAAALEVAQADRIAA